ncbi:hypothetical protein [Nitrobacter sp.]|uniref:hypothetical protein n=1 Tax=Nitrobacter sp. TaxID=29420 RepID=UPI001D746842|nr:hypothetical protein [Nitrobacter sp.]MCB1391884.1 hypothetical protein [Nitrobacter sp.]
MDKKPKAGSTKKKAVPKKKAPDEKQFERFVRTARELGADEDAASFEKAFKKIVKPSRTEKYK